MINKKHLVQLDMDDTQRSSIGMEQTAHSITLPGSAEWSCEGAVFRRELTRPDDNFFFPLWPKRVLILGME